MRRSDQWASLFGIALGVNVVVFSLRMSLGTWNQPGPGTFPLISGVLLIALSVTYAVQSTWTRDSDYLKKASPWPKENRGRLIGLLGTLFLYSFFLNTLGFPLATFMVMVFLFRLIDAEGWVMPIIEAAVAVLVTYVVFNKLLMVQFPKGFIGW